MEFKEIKGYENYLITSDGNVMRNGKILKQWKNHRGYQMITLSKNGNQKSFSVHRLVAIAFIPNIENKAEVDHINTIRDDNRVENLKWVTRKENNQNPLTKLHNSECRKGEKHYLYGKHISNETKEKMSKSLKGHSVSNSTKEKIGNANRGKKRSEEFKKNLSEKLKGRFTGSFNHSSKSVIQYSKTMVAIEEYDCIRIASERTSTNRTSISNCLNGRNKTAGGYIWKYKK